MKKYIYSLFAAVLLVLTSGCSKDDEGSRSINSGVVGEWHLTMWNNEMPSDFDVYIEFMSDGTFNSYEKVETSFYVKYSGSFSVDGSRLSGRYNDGAPWRTTYDIELSSDSNTLTMNSNANSAVVTAYTRTTIPTSVKDVHEVRSGLHEKSLRIL